MKMIAPIAGTSLSRALWLGSKMPKQFWVLTVLTMLIQLGNAQLVGLHKARTCKLKRWNWVPPTPC